MHGFSCDLLYVYSNLRWVFPTLKYRRKKRENKMHVKMDVFNILTIVKYNISPLKITWGINMRRYETKMYVSLL